MHFYINLKKNLEKCALTPPTLLNSPKTFIFNWISVSRFLITKMTITWKKSNAKKEERKIYVEEQQQQPVQSETHNWRVLCMRETKKAIWHILFHSLFVIITFIMRFFFHSEASSAQPSMPVDSFTTICLLSQTESTWRGREQ